jgi:CAAX protease family protein
MNTILRPIRNYPIAAFVVLACLFGWIQFIAYAFGADIVPDGMPVGPIVAALIVAACLGRAEFREWARRLTTFGAGIGWYALALVAPIAIITMVALANYSLGATPPTASQLAIWTELPGTFVFFLIFVGIGEEAGWTAFAAPMLLRSNNFIRTWLILSAIRVFWHLPLMLSGDLPWVLGIGGNIAFQFLVLWIFQRGDQGWFLAALWHATLNTFGGKFFFQLVDGTDEARLAILMTVGYVIVALAVFFLDQSHLDQPKEVQSRYV